MEAFSVLPQALAHLRARDPALGAVIDTVAPPCRALTPDLFAALIESIAGQQISAKAHQTMCRRLHAAFPALTPRAVFDTPEEALRALGLSGRKVQYMKSAAAAVLEGRLDLCAARAMDDDAFCRALTALPGVGVWTAEMLLIFSLGRPDVLSRTDFGIRRGLCMVHGLACLSAQDFARFRALYTPYGTTASLYLWAVAAGAVPGLTDCALQTEKAPPHTPAK